MLKKSPDPKDVPIILLSYRCLFHFGPNPGTIDRHFLKYQHTVVMEFFSLHGSNTPSQLTSVAKPESTRKLESIM